MTKEQSEKEIKMSPSVIALKRIKYSGINLTKKQKTFVHLKLQNFAERN